MRSSQCVKVFKSGYSHLTAVPFSPDVDPLPAAQSAQLLEPVEDMYVPEEHSEQMPSPAFEYVPVAHEPVHVTVWPVHTSPTQ